MADAIVYLRERTPAEIVIGALGPRMRGLGATQADGVLLGSVTPGLALGRGRGHQEAGHGGRRCRASTST